MPRLEGTVQLTRKTRFWKYLLPAVAAVIVVALAVMPRSVPAPSYRRFTSPAFPDGVRYTFLYPSALDDVLSYSLSANSKYSLLQTVTVSQKESRLPGAALWQSWFKPEAEFVFVTVKKPVIKPLKSSRSEELSERHGNGAHMVEIEHAVLIDDPRAHEHFRFWHASDYGTASFKQHDQVVTSSFRVLMPGEPVPTP